MNPRQISIALVAAMLIGCHESRHSVVSTATPNAVNSGQSQQRTLLGTVRRVDGAGLAAATISIDGIERARTDAQGRFIVKDPPAGDVVVEIDGTSVIEPGARYTSFTVAIGVNSIRVNRLPNIVTLIDLNTPSTASGLVATDMDGASIAAIDVTGADPDLRLTGAAGTRILIDGVPAQGDVLLELAEIAAAVAPLPLVEAPVPAVVGFPGFGPGPGPGGGTAPDAMRSFDVTAYATIQPANASFESALDASLPNRRDYPVGSVVDLWWFDQAEDRWINRTKETGRQAIVVDAGAGMTRIAATGLIDRGGWYAAAVPTSDCKTRVVGHVADANGDDVANAIVASGLGQTTRTDQCGDFELADVPAYVASDELLCTTIELTLSVSSSLESGGTTIAVPIAAGLVQPGAETDVGEIRVDLSSAGSLVGRVASNAAGLSGNVEIARAGQTMTASSAPDGSFFFSRVDPGSYTATFNFPSGQRVVGFDVVEHEVTTIDLQELVGAGTERIEILVRFDEDGFQETTPYCPASGATVTLIGTDVSSAQGLTGICNEDGLLAFESVEGPYTVTAQLDFLVSELSGETGRTAASLIEIEPDSGTIGLRLENIQNFDFPGPPASNLTGTIANFPPIEEFGPGEVVLVMVKMRPELQTVFEAIDPFSGTYSVMVPSDELLDVALIRVDCPTLDCLTLPPPVSAQFTTSIAPIAPGASATLDFDFADQVPFDLPVELTYTGVAPGVNFTILRFGLSSADGAFFDFELADPFAGDAFPSSVILPDVTHPGLSGFTANLFMLTTTFGYQGPTGADNICTVPLSTTPRAATFAFLGETTISQPTGMELFSVSDLDGLTIDYTHGLTPGFGSTNLLIMSAGPGGFALDHVLWRIDVPPSKTSVTLPVRARPMFGAAMSYNLSVFANASESPVPDYDDFFDGDVEANFEALNAQGPACSSARVVFLNTQ